jgi:hypothetical protein
MNLLQACLYLHNSYYAQQVEVDMEELLIVILPGTEQILEVTRKYYRPSTMLVPCHSAGTCPAGLLSRPLSSYGIRACESLPKRTTILTVHR